MHYLYIYLFFFRVFSHIALFSCPLMSDSLGPTDCSSPGFPALHWLLEFAQTCIH